MRIPLIRRSDCTAAVALARMTFGLLLLTFVMSAGSAFAQQSGNESEASEGPPFIPQGQLAFLKYGTGAAIKVITIQIADNNAQRAEGLMWRRYMPEDDGMLFIFDDQEILNFWMKNTYIPLDMVFADKSGKIVSIFPEATPLNESTISSEKPAQYVVEVNGGFCSRFGINVGDSIEFER